MNLQELDRLLEKYYSGNSSADEEIRLLDLMASESLPDEYNNDRKLLLGMISNDRIPEPDSGFESRIMSRIDESELKGKIVTIKRRLYSIVAVAASLLIVISSYFILSRSVEPIDTFDDPVLAYNATIEVLQQVGRSLDMGTDVLSELAIIGETRENLIMLSQPAREATKNMESLRYIEKGIDLLDPR